MTEYKKKIQLWKRTWALNRANQPPSKVLIFHDIKSDLHLPANKTWEHGIVLQYSDEELQQMLKVKFGCQDLHLEMK